MCVCVCGRMSLIISFCSVNWEKIPNLFGRQRWHPVELIDVVDDRQCRYVLRRSNYLNYNYEDTKKASCCC